MNNTDVKYDSNVTILCWPYKHKQFWPSYTSLKDMQCTSWYFPLQTVDSIDNLTLSSTSPIRFSIEFEDDYVPEDDDDRRPNDADREELPHASGADAANGADDVVDNTRASRAEIQQWVADVERETREEENEEEKEEKEEEKEEKEEEEEVEDAVSQETREIIENGGWRMGLAVGRLHPVFILFIYLFN